MHRMRGQAPSKPAFTIPWGCDQAQQGHDQKHKGGTRREQGRFGCSLSLHTCCMLLICVTRCFCPVAIGFLCNEQLLKHDQL